MTLSDHDLTQIDTSYPDGLSERDLRSLSKKLLVDLKEARERLNQTPETSSRPPSSREPWQSTETKDATGPEEPLGEADENAADTVSPSPPNALASPLTPVQPTKPAGKPGRRKGSQGHSREISLPITHTQYHCPDGCAACNQPFGEETALTAWTGRYELELTTGSPEQSGLQIEHIHHIYHLATCTCGHQTRAKPGRCPDEPDWTVSLTEWHLCGPRLVSLLVCLSLHMRVSLRNIQDFLKDWLHIDLSTSTINHCLHEAGRAVDPVVNEQLLAELKAADLLYIDETSWKESGKLVWLWSFVSVSTVVFRIGKRHRLVVQQLLGDAFHGFIMTDGFSVYRVFPRRLRCWAHLVRKARALYQSLDVEAQAFGEALLLMQIMLMRNIYRLREDLEEDSALGGQNQVLLDLLRQLCEAHQSVQHEGCQKLAREFLNDWEAITRVVETPAYPLTNNVAERSLRHWVIVRRLTFGSRTAQGSRIVALLASVIGSARLRQINPWPFIAQVIAARRKNLPAPALPMPALV